MYRSRGKAAEAEAVFTGLLTRHNRKSAFKSELNARRAGGLIHELLHCRCRGGRTDSGRVFDVCFGAVLFDETLEKSFYGQTRPVSDRFIPGALAVSGFTREQHLAFDDPKAVMETFADWLDQHSKGRPVFVSDNLAFDWQFVNYYFHRFVGRNPFGFSGRRIGDLYAAW